MDFDNMKKDKDFQKWCFDTELVGNKNWFNLENGSGDEVYIAYEAWVAGQQSKQAEIEHRTQVSAELAGELIRKRAEIDALKSKVQELWTELDDRQSKEHIIKKCEAIIQEILK